MRLRLLLAGAGSVAVAAAMAFGISLPAQGTAFWRAAPAPQGIHKIKHVVVIMQENRSFDSYFGTYPGAVGIPPGVCVPDPVNGGCVKPSVDHSDSNTGGPHTDPNALADVDGGKMDGFVGQAELRCKQGQQCTTDVMGHHVGSDIPNYWAYAHNFVLQDHMFESEHSWSLPAHMDMVSAWSANCSNPADPMSCTATDMPKDRTPTNPRPFAWTDLTWLLHKNNISWGYYLDHGALSANNPRGRAHPLEHPARVHRRQAGRPGGQRPGPDQFLRTGQGGHAARGVVDRARSPRQRAPALAGEYRPGVRDPDHQRGHAQQ
jgi:phospholipase C